MKKYMLMGVALVLMFTEAQSAIAYPFGEHAASKIASSLSGMVAMIWGLRDTPEPGSLFLLGGILLSLALFVAWKSARSSKGYSDAALVRVEQTKSDAR